MFSSRLLRGACRILSKLQRSHSTKSDYSKFIRLGALATGAAFFSFSTAICDVDQIKEFPACRAEEIPEGSMKKVQIGENEENYILLSRVNGKFYATGGKCSHYGAPLHAGFLDGFTVICPWHCAAFDVRTGELVQSPGLNSIPTYEVVERNGSLVVRIPESKVAAVTGANKSKKLGKRDPSNNTTFVVVGGGAAGAVAVETLRREGFTGRILFLTAEALLPYDRVPLTKNFNLDSAKLEFRTQQFYEEHDIEVHKNAEVQSIDQNLKVVKLKNGQEFGFDKLLLATGCKSKVPGPLQKYASNFSNVFTLRTAADHSKFKPAVQKAEDVVIIGAGFIGLESAKAIKTAWPTKNVTVIEVDDKRLGQILGKEIASQLVTLQRVNGINVLLGQPLGSFEGKDGVITKIVLPTHIAFAAAKNTTEIKADVVLLATGAEVNTSYVPPNLVNPDGSVRVNSHLQTEDSSIYAAGDIAQFPSILSESRERVEHWAVAEQQGRLAALNMLGKGQNYMDVPFFWTNQFVNVQFAGYSTGHDWTWTETRGEDQPAKTQRITYFFKGERCIGAAAVNWPGAILRLKIALQRGLMPSKRDLAKGDNYEGILERVKKSNPCGGGTCCRG